MNRLAIIAPDKDLASLCEKVVQEIQFPAKISIRVGSTNNGINLARIEKKKGAEVIISRGGTAILIRNENLDIPVVEVEVTAYDLIYSLNNARKLANRIVVVGFENVLNAIRGIDRVIEEMGNLKIITQKVNADTEIEGVVKETVAKLGTENLVFIGGNLVVDMAEETGCAGCIAISQ